MSGWWPSRLAHEGERGGEIGQPERALDAVRVVDQLPVGRLGMQPLGLLAGERRHAAAARRAGLLGKRGSHGRLPASVKGFAPLMLGSTHARGKPAGFDGRGRAPHHSAMDRGIRSDEAHRA